MIRAVLFDMDGTLVDSMPLYERSWRFALETLGLHEDVLSLRRQMAGRCRKDISALLRERFGENFPVEDLCRVRDSFILQSLAEEGVPLKPGVPEIFDELHSLGCKIALVTSSLKNRTEAVCKATGIAPYFDTIVTGEEVVHSKPEPEIFLLGAKRLCVDPSECVVAEDAASGVLAGFRAGMRVVMIPDLYPVGDAEKPLLWKSGNTLCSLPDWIREENRKNV